MAVCCSTTMPPCCRAGLRGIVLVRAQVPQVLEVSQGAVRRGWAIAEAMLRMPRESG